VIHPLALPLLAAAFGGELAFTPVASGFDKPLQVTYRAGDFDDLFVVEQTGRVHIVRDGVVQPTPYLNLSAQISSGFDAGLLGMAFHPDYPTVRESFVVYTDSNADTVIARFDEDPQNADVALPGSETVVYGPVAQPGPLHNGGGLAFAPDGTLFVALGDGNDPQTFGLVAQDLTSPLGKILRLDPDLPFPHVPASNPFVGVPGALDEIWAYGVRNPWRISVDPLTGELFVADVGLALEEEISVLPPGVGGLNLGWNCIEGVTCTPFTACTCTDPTLHPPAHSYPNNQSPNCAVIGGFRYRGCAIPSLDGHYVFGDFCSNRIWTFEWDGTSAFNLIDRTSDLPPIAQLSSFGQDAFGELYVVERGLGRVRRIVPETPGPDCNVNGIADACEIAFGLVLDEDQNGIPDACECPPPVVYCTAKTNSQGCLPMLASQGSPSLSIPLPFDVTVTDALNNKTGIFFYGLNGPVAAPFFGGTLCVQPPIRRTPIQFSGGTPPPAADCSGTLTFDFNDWIQSGQDPLIAAGNSVALQAWMRDPQSSFGVSLSDAVEALVCP